jgi:hypothetical protein
MYFFTFLAIFLRGPSPKRSPTAAKKSSEEIAARRPLFLVTCYLFCMAQGAGPKRT